MRQTRTKIWLLILPPLVIFLKDVAATMAVLSTEPGITARAKLYYVIALLPGALVVDNAGSAMLVNLLFGALLGLVLYLLLTGRKKPS